MYGQLISSVTVGSGGASSLDFTSIPGTYTDLVLVTALRSTTANTVDGFAMTFNGSSTGYSWRNLYGDGSAKGSGNGSGSSLQTAYALVGASATANTFSNVIITIPNYAGSTNKSVSIDGVAENNATAAGQILNAGLWSNTSAITSISINYVGLTIAQYSTAYLYGLTKGSGGATVS